MRYGTEDWQRLFKQVYEETGVHHPAKTREPALRSDCIPYFDAFRFLGASRKWSQVGPQPIEMKEIMALLVDGLGIDDADERMKYVRLIQGMDRVELNYRAEKAATK